MTILCDKEIIELCEKESMISPFEKKLINTDNAGNKLISYGVSSYGYDSKLSDEFYIFTDVNNETVDPKKFSKDNLVYKKAPFCIIPPNSFALATTSEYFRIPKDILVVCVGKSTYARCGLIINVTPLEPGWEGNVTIEISNTTRLPVKVYANEGICQFLFFKGNECINTYSSRNGKYQNQTGITLPLV